MRLKRPDQQPFFRFLQNTAAGLFCPSGGKKMRPAPLRRHFLSLEMAMHPCGKPSGGKN
jgi:hypothetical protein